ncbi:uncharacterized protein [Spinacia oleracea]|uniref:Uncharacterized protein n=1 Tax=Spinacia oleracea TaxID=3562 RepID=A0A9R0IIE0_SPIOL|nr:uncharacterized protein LOC110788877 [Spinacia oleracea]
MGWTVFACFGCPNKRKRPKTPSKFGSKNRRRIRGYEPLQSDIPKELNESTPLGSLREKQKDEPKARIRKKVRFNLEVVTYEPLISQEDEHDDYNRGEKGGKETDQATVAVEGCLIYTPLSKTVSTESNYRYNSCYDGEDEYDEDEDECQITDDDDDEDEDEDEDYEDDDDDDDGCTIDPRIIYYNKVTDELRDCSSVPLVSSATNARLRSHYIVPVLNPIENLSQWKTVKTRKC